MTEEQELPGVKVAVKMTDEPLPAGRSCSETEDNRSGDNSVHDAEVVLPLWARSPEPRATSRPRRRLQNVLTRMEDAQNGPFNILHRSVVQRLKVKVWTRNYKHIRGICTGYVIAFDKHLNLAMADVDEVYRNPVTMMVSKEKKKKKRRRKKKDLDTTVEKKSPVEASSIPGEPQSAREKNGHLSTQADIKTFVDKRDSEDVDSAKRLLDQSNSSLPSESDESEHGEQSGAYREGEELKEEEKDLTSLETKLQELRAELSNLSHSEKGEDSKKTSHGCEETRREISRYESRRKTSSTRESKHSDHSHSRSRTDSRSSSSRRYSRSDSQGERRRRSASRDRTSSKSRRKEVSSRGSCSPSSSSRSNPSRPRSRRGDRLRRTSRSRSRSRDRSSYSRRDLIHRKCSRSRSVSQERDRSSNRQSDRLRRSDNRSKKSSRSPCPDAKRDKGPNCSSCTAESGSCCCKAKKDRSTKETSCSSETSKLKIVTCETPALPPTGSQLSSQDDSRKVNGQQPSCLAEKYCNTDSASVQATSTEQQLMPEFLERHVNQLFIRGDNVVMVSLFGDG